MINVHGARWTVKRHLSVANGLLSPQLLLLQQLLRSVQLRQWNRRHAAPSRIPSVTT